MMRRDSLSHSTLTTSTLKKWLLSIKNSVLLYLTTLFQRKMLKRLSMNCGRMCKAGVENRWIDMTKPLGISKNGEETMDL